MTGLLHSFISREKSVLEKHAVDAMAPANQSGHGAPAKLM